MPSSWFDFAINSYSTFKTTPEIPTPHDTRRMSGNRPRPSIISLFDPLANSTTSEIPSTPHRNASDADKENRNDSPNSLTMTMFVNKITKPATYPQPAPPKHRLIDIGDMTLEDASRPETLLDESLEEEFSTGFDQAEDEEDATLTFKDMVKAATPIRTLKTVVESPTSNSFPMPRIPPVDISLEQTTPARTRQSFPPEALSGKLIRKESISMEDAILKEPVPEELKRPELATKSPIAPEDVPLPPSPITPTQELSPLNSPAGEVDDTGNSLGETSHSGFSVMADHQSTPSMAEGQVSGKPVATLETSKSNSFTPANLTEPFEPPLGETSIPIIVSPSSPHAAIMPLPEPGPELESDEENAPSARLRPNKPNTSSNDRNRVSVDLHASFQMQMQSEDMSFDLLSDKLSFLNPQSGMESFLSTVEDDPSFDLEMERINMERALKTYSDRKEDKATVMDDVSSVSSSPAPATPVDMPSTPSTPAHQPGDTQPTRGSDLKTIRKRMSIPIAVSSPRLIDTSSPPTATNLLSRSPSLSLSPSNGNGLRAPLCSPATSTSPVFAPPIPVEKRRRSLQLTTPKPAKETSIPSLPPAVPALKIVKRPRTNGHERSDSTLGTSGSVGNAHQKGVSAAPPKVLELPKIVALKTRKAAKEQETAQPAEPEPQPTPQLTRPKSLVPPRASVTTTQTNGSGPRRVPVSEGPQLKSAAPRAGTMPVPSTGGPRRVPAPSTSALPSTQTRPSAIPSGLKAPTQLGTTWATASSLPKAVSRTSALTSRLPAPKSMKSGGLPTLRRVT